MVAFRAFRRSPETAVISTFPFREHRRDACGRAAGATGGQGGAPLRRAEAPCRRPPAGCANARAAHTDRAGGRPSQRPGADTRQFSTCRRAVAWPPAHAGWPRRRRSGPPSGGTTRRPSPATRAPFNGTSRNSGFLITSAGRVLITMPSNSARRMPSLRRMRMIAWSRADSKSRARPLPVISSRSSTNSADRVFGRPLTAA